MEDIKKDNETIEKAVLQREIVLLGGKIAENADLRALRAQKAKLERHSLE